MRTEEAQQVVDTFESSQGIELIHIQAAERFFEQLKGVLDPEEKRKIIGHYRNILYSIMNELFNFFVGIYSRESFCGTGEHFMFNIHDGLRNFPGRWLPYDQVQFEYILKFWKCTGRRFS